MSCGLVVRFVTPTWKVVGLDTHCQLEEALGACEVTNLVSISDPIRISDA